MDKVTWCMSQWVSVCLCNTVIGKHRVRRLRVKQGLLGFMVSILCLPFLSHSLVANPGSQSGWRLNIFLTLSSQGQVSDIRKDRGQEVADTRSLLLISFLGWFLLLAHRAFPLPNREAIGHEEL